MYTEKGCFDKSVWLVYFCHVISFIFTIGLKKYLWFRFSDQAYFFLPTLLFFQHDWLCNPNSPGGCGLLIQRAKIASVVTPTIEPNWLNSSIGNTHLLLILMSGLYWKLWKKYETRTTDIFLGPRTSKFHLYFSGSWILSMRSFLTIECMCTKLECSITRTPP
jgi:hypothetical protein